MFVDRSIRADSIFVHLIYQIRLSEIAWWLCFAIREGDLRLKYLALCEFRQHHVLPLFVGKYF